MPNSYVLIDRTDTTLRKLLMAVPKPKIHKATYPLRVTTANSTSYTIATIIRTIPRPRDTLDERTIGGLYKYRASP